MSFKDFDIEDFLRNQFFVDWVLKEDFSTDQFWTKWLEKNPEKRDEVEAAREVIKSMHYGSLQRLSSDESNAMLESILHHDVADEGIRNSRWSIAHYGYKVAASVTIFLAIVASIFLWPDEQPVPVVETIWKTVSTEHGQKKIVYLPDGTKVMMNSGSSITYPVPFSEEKRKVSFNGEGFFDVTHNPKMPFIIESSSFSTCVLGTSFNLRTYPGEEKSSVSVVTGKVKLHNEKGELATLTAARKGTYDHSTQEVTTGDFDEYKITAWTEGVLIFENENLRDIFQKLEKWYGVKITIDDNVNLSGKYNGEYKHKSLEMILEGLSYTSKFNFSISNQIVRIYDKNLTKPD